MAVVVLQAPKESLQSCKRLIFHLMVRLAALPEPSTQASYGRVTLIYDSMY